MSGRRSSHGRGNTSAAPISWPAPGSFLAADAGGIPVLATRDIAGELHAFINVCRHRGAVLTEGCGERATIQCHYHAWTYDLDGTLRAAPRSEREDDFDPADWSLLPASVGTLGAVPVRQPRPRGAVARGAARRPARDPCPRHRPRRDHVPFACRLQLERELEDRGRELPRVLPLPDRTPGLQRRGRRPPRPLSARGTPDVLGAVRDGEADGRARPVPPAVPEHRHQRLPRPGQPLDRPDLAERNRPDRALPRLLLRARRRSRVARRVLRLRRPGRPRGHRARRVRAPRDGVRACSTTAACW